MIDVPQVEMHYTIESRAIKSHLILHFDVNRTLIFLDAGQNQSPEDVIVNGLADRLEYMWDETLTHPINFTNYVKYHLFPNPERSREIKAKQKNQTTNFLPYLRERNHPLYPEAMRLFERAQRAAQTQKTLVFPSFYRLLDHLKENQIGYTLVFRTFGGDIKEVADELNQRMGMGFLNHFYLFDKGSFKSKDGEGLNFYECIKNASHHIAVQDDWNWWFKHHENYQYGKAFPVDFGDPSRKSLFFDDNARINQDHPEYNIVAPFSISEGKALTPGEMIEKKYLFPVDPIEALCDEDYFVKLISE